MSSGAAIRWGRSRCSTSWGLATTYYIANIMFEEYARRLTAAALLSAWCSPGAWEEERAGVYRY